MTWVGSEKDWEKGAKRLKLEKTHAMFAGTRLPLGGLGRRKWEERWITIEEKRPNTHSSLFHRRGGTVMVLDQGVGGKLVIG